MPREEGISRVIGLVLALPLVLVMTWLVFNAAIAFAQRREEQAVTTVRHETYNETSLIAPIPEGKPAEPNAVFEPVNADHFSYIESISIEDFNPGDYDRVWVRVEVELEDGSRAVIVPDRMIWGGGGGAMAQQVVWDRLHWILDAVPTGSIIKKVLVYLWGERFSVTKQQAQGQAKVRVTGLQARLQAQ